MIHVRLSRRTIAALLVAAAVAYVGLFYYQRQLRTITFVRDGRFFVARMFYFSEHQAANTVQWWIFRPLFAWNAGDPRHLHAALLSAEGVQALRPDCRFYVNDLSDLRLVSGK